MRISVRRNVYFRPTRSPRRPKTNAPNGLTIRPAAKVARVEGNAAGNTFRYSFRQCAWANRFHKTRAMEQHFQYLWRTWNANWAGSRLFAIVRGSLGNCNRFDASDHLEKTRCRPGYFFRPICCHACGCNRACDLFLDGVPLYVRQLIIKR